MKQSIAFAAIAMAALMAFGEKQPLERYQSIIDRMPFGVPPPGFDPTRDPSEVAKDAGAEAAAAAQLTEEQQAIQRAVRFSVLNMDEGGVVHVGFSDISDPKAPRHFYMTVGEERYGWTVKEADANEKSMLVVKDGVEVRLKLGEDSGSDAKSIAAARSASAGARGRSELLARGDGETNFVSPRGRREKRLAEEAAAREAARKREEDRKREAAEREQREAEERAQREAERNEQRAELNALQEELRRQREEMQNIQRQEADAAAVQEE